MKLPYKEIVIYALIGGLIGGIISTCYSSYQLNRLIFTYEQDLRVQHEYLKACEANRMYLENVLDNNGIDHIK